MKDNIDNTLEFLGKLFNRLTNFAILMCVVTIISTVLISIFNEDVALKIGCINMLIGLIPLTVALLLGMVLCLIRLIIYGED